MYHILPESEGNVIGIKIIDGLRPEDYETLFPFIDQFIAEHEMIRVLYDLRDLKHIYFRALFKVLFRRIRDASHVDKKAIVTDEQWIYILEKLSSPFFRTEVRLFPSTAVEEAWEWVKR